MTYYWILTQIWIINNIFAFSLCFVVLSIFTIRNFKICIILLSCIFLYDAFWVFFSKEIFQKNVMLEVAVNLNVPIKFEMPIFFSSNPLRGCTILGLGDIVLPGIIIKYCKSFDYLKIANADSVKNPKSNYFKFIMKIYLLSVICAFIMNFVFQHPQPVLFYIAPAFIFGMIYYSIKFKEFKEFMSGENFKQMQICVDEIVNTEFSKIEDKRNNLSEKGNYNNNNYIDNNYGKGNRDINLNLDFNLNSNYNNNKLNNGKFSLGNKEDNVIEISEANKITEFKKIKELNKDKKGKVKFNNIIIDNKNFNNNENNKNNNIDINKNNNNNKGFEILDDEDK
jgi:hypothetical protein